METAPQSVRCVLNKDNHSIQFRFSDGLSENVDSDVVQGSPILQNTICTLAEQGNDSFELPSALASRMVHAWAVVAAPEAVLPPTASRIAECLQSAYAARSDRHQVATSSSETIAEEYLSHLGKLRVPAQLQQVWDLQAADFLADERVLQRLCGAFAAGLFPDKSYADPLFLQELQCLMPEVVTRVLATSVQKLDTQINLLPVNMQILAVHAAFPSIRKSKSLILDCSKLSMRSAVAALTCFASFTSTVNLALLGCPAGMDTSEFVEAVGDALSSCPSKLTISQVGSSIFSQIETVMNRKVDALEYLDELRLERNDTRVEGGIYAPSKPLQSLTRLRILGLEGNSIGDAGAVLLAASLTAMTGLQQLNLGSTDIADSGVGFLAHSLQFLTQLRELRLPNNQIGNDGATALAGSFSNLSELRVLHLQNNYFMDDGCVALAESIFYLYHLSSLQLENNSLYEGAVVLAQKLSSLQNLKFLDLSDCKIGDWGATALAKSLKYLGQLEHLGLSFNFVQDPHARLMTSLTSLSHLTSLDVKGNAFGTEGAVALSHSLSSLTNMHRLKLGGNTIGDEGVASLSQRFPFLCCLVELQLGNNSIGVEGMSVLAAKLPCLSQLQTLDLSGNRIGRQGATQLAQVLGSLENLEELSLAYNGIGDEGAKVLSETLPRASTLKRLSLAGNGIGDDGAMTLAHGMLQLHQLNAFSLTGSAGSLRHFKPIGFEGTVALVQSLTCCGELQSLSLVRTCMGDQGAGVLGHCLTTLTALTLLNLESNGIGCEGAVAIASSLPCLWQLHDLLLPGNIIGDTGGPALVEGIASLAQLSRLNLMNNRISVEAKTLCLGFMEFKCRNVFANTARLEL